MKHSLHNIAKPRTVAIAMSGGVDSSVTAAKLKKQGYNCFGVHLDLWSETSSKAKEINKRHAEEVCKKIGIPFHIVNLKSIFKKKIVDYYLKAYKKGETPNPCVVCNKEIKFGKLLERVRKMGADYLATGHYARVKKTKTGYELHKGEDIRKDQSYFLYKLSQDQLKYVMFPLGEMTKVETKKIAREIGLEFVEEKPESQGICFVPDKVYTDFLKRNISKKYFKEGLIMDMEGNKLGRHRGLPYYTCGQREGLMIGGLKKPLYVIKADHKKNILLVGEDKYIWHDEIKVDELSFTGDKVPTKNMKIDARVRHLGHLESAIVTMVGRDKAKVKFLKPIRAFTEGQSIVFYKGSKVIGGGIMRK